jgi:AcrR family transcriptional regulator
MATSGLMAKAPASAAPGGAPQLSPKDWVDAAMAVLVDQGIDHVRVDVLAKQLGVTRGSFYWHFRDREDLLRRVLQSWSERTTAQLTERLKQARTNPLEQLQDLASLPHRGRAAAKAARIEMAIRAWARRDAEAAAVLQASDAARIGYHQQVFEALGFAEAEAKARAYLLYGYEVAESLMPHGTPPDREARQGLLLRLLTKP